MVSLPQILEVWRDSFEAFYAKAARDLYPSEERLHLACRYALEGAGKRIRPLLAMASAHAVGGDYRCAMHVASALEWIHTYSLVHDDLPCMDNDDWRRGRLTTHKKFDDAIALLVGDALLSDAFFLLSQSTAPQPMMFAILAKAAGGRGMVRGQALDMHWTGRADFNRQDLDTIHRHKTADLIGASCVLGAAAAGADKDTLRLLEDFGQALGLAFQIVDDLLDSSDATGKSVGKDRASGKLTYLSLMSEGAARAEAAALTKRTEDLLLPLGDRATPLLQIAHLLLERQH